MKLEMPEQFILMNFVEFTTFIKKYLFESKDLFEQQLIFF